MSVDIAASTGDGARVQGDAVTFQGLYRIAAHTAVINEVITAAHATLPRNDLVVLEAEGHAARRERLDPRADPGDRGHRDVRRREDRRARRERDTHPPGLGDRAGGRKRSGGGCVGDEHAHRRPPQLRVARRLWRQGIIATEESRTNTAYGPLATPDVVKGIVLPTDGLIVVGYRHSRRRASSPRVARQSSSAPTSTKHKSGGRAGPVPIAAVVGPTNTTYHGLASYGG